MVYKINICANRLCLSFLAPQAGSLSSGISSLSPGLRSESACWSGGSYRRLQRASLQASGSYWPFLWVYCHVLSLCLHVAFSSVSLCPKFPLLVRISVKLHLGFTLNLCDFLFTWWHLQTPYFLLRFCMNTSFEASLVAQMEKHLPAVWEMWVRSLGRRIPWTEELGGLQSTGRKETDTTSLSLSKPH